MLLGVTYVLFSQQLGSGGPLSVNSDGIEEAPSPAPRGDAQPSPELSAFEESERERLNDAAVTSLLTLGGIALAVVATAAGGLGWLIAGRVLAPLRQVTDTARRIAAAPTADRSLHERITLAGPRDEAKDLADAFDTMVERLDRSFDGQRRFVANASHELRTPSPSATHWRRWPCTARPRPRTSRSSAKNSCRPTTGMSGSSPACCWPARRTTSRSRHRSTWQTSSPMRSPRAPRKRSGPASPCMPSPAPPGRPVTRCSSNASCRTSSTTASGTTPPPPTDGSASLAVPARSTWRSK
ncbi:HAMP domain-containing protein [Streptomyces millisiae]|uniref:histidine kinase n=1 Tax=Streptomyces millisiae TaxID=3075542 RepID=A0ABU2LKG0_9ACTN|nr:HAMP domain-containing protein [Streptomyces sp. DSM 44918]MDT0318031.1 HAMP domain-containing protein [Streptomyces sp. DSM 44918]